MNGLGGQPHMFGIEECQRAATTPKESFLSCPADRNGEAAAVRLDAAAPDLAMVHLDSHRIDYADLHFQEPPIGEGGYATVYKGTYRGQVVAIKKLRSAAVDSMLDAGVGESLLLTYEEFRNEVYIMSGLAHPNLVALCGFCMKPTCIVTEYVGGGSLVDYLSNAEKMLDWPLRLKIAKDIGKEGLHADVIILSAELTHCGSYRVLPTPAKGCAFLHSTSPPIMHRDLKSPNVLLVDVSPGAAVVAKVCDFGVSLNAASQTAGRRVDCPGAMKCSADRVEDLISTQ